VSLFSSEITLLQIFGLTNLIGFNDITWIVLAANCIAGAFLGAIGTIFSMGKHLKV
jgi:cell division transport system permease protein